MDIELNREWTFTKKDGSSKVIDLPHDAMIEEKRYKTCASESNSGFFPGGYYIYTKDINISEQDLDKDVSLFFEGVYGETTVFVNDSEVGKNLYGYLEFEFNINNFIKEGLNKIKVICDNSLYPNCRWYTGSGIYRSVFLRINEKEFVKNVKVHTLSLSPKTIKITSDCDLNGYLFEIYEGDKLLLESKESIINCDSLKLWDSENPNIYQLVLKKGDQTFSQKFGIRTLSFSSETGLLVNGNEVLLRGGCVHHDNGVIGARCYKDSEYRKVKILKEQGFNAIRCAHNPASRELLDACDELGMYVLDESFDGWYTPKTYHDYSHVFTSIYENVFDTLVMKDFNHPSVIMYSLGNEVSEITDPKGVKMAKTMYEYLKRLDDTRPITYGINVAINVLTKHKIGMYKDDGKYKKEPIKEDKAYKGQRCGSSFFNAMMDKVGGGMFLLSKGKTAEKMINSVSNTMDVIGYNYATPRYDIDFEKHKNYLICGTETMAMALPENWKRVKEHKQLIGDFVWSAIDYIGETCMGWTYSSYKGLPLLSNQGMIDITGYPLASMEFMQLIWGIKQGPVINVQPYNHAKETPAKGSWQFTNALKSWSWQPYTGVKGIVEVYSTAFKVRLLLNGRKIGEKSVKDYRANFKVKYFSGTLTAIDLDENSKELSRSEISTGKGEISIHCNIDKSILNSNGSDLCYCDIEFLYDDKKLVPYLEKECEISIDGDSISLIGFGSALYKTDETFTSNKHSTYRGRAQAVFKAGYKKGTSEVTVSSSGYKPFVFKVEVI